MMELRYRSRRRFLAMWAVIMLVVQHEDLAAFRAFEKNRLVIPILRIVKGNVVGLQHVPNLVRLDSYRRRTASTRLHGMVGTAFSM